MKKSLRILSLLLAVLMLFAVLVACKKDDQQGGGENNGGGGDTVVNSDPYGDELPALNYNNATVSVLCSMKDTVADEFYSEGISTNTISSAVYTRNENVKGRLGVNLNIIPDETSRESIGKINQLLSDAIMVGDSTYDIVVGATYLTTASVTKDHYRNLKNCEYINLDKLYWSQGFNKAFSWGTDRQYLATGSAVISIYRFMYCTIFNKDMFKNAQEPALYDIVNQGKWTLEYQTQLAKKFYVAGDAETTIYGVSAGDQICIDPYWVALDVPVVTKDGNNNFVLTISDTSAKDKLSKAVDQILKLYNDNSNYIAPYSNDGFTTRTKSMEMFFNERAAMATAVVYNIERSMNELAAIDYGIVPMPKYNEDQAGYYSALQDQVSCLGIARTVTDDRLQMVGAVMECLAAESYKTVVDEYYGNVLQHRYSQDPDSKEMLKVIYEGSSMTMTAVYTGAINKNLPNNEGFTTFLRNLVRPRINMVTSKFRGLDIILSTNITELNTTFATLEGKT